MYESHFGFKASPFQLNPDPDFYFDSSGHNKALAHLRYGVEQGEGFIVITGEVGAGKTTLVRTLLQQLDARELVVAQISNTQLDADNLLQTVLTAFGVSAGGMSKASMIASLEAFLTSVAASGRRALLLIDEAQNLSPQALEELRMLSNFQLGKHGLLQSFLVGQPELRQQLQLPSMQQLQQRVLASYHLGPLDVAETAAYVLHRLRLVGWTGQRPAIDTQAMSRLHSRSGGIPRRINLLCNRLLLAAYLAESTAISAAMVDEVADEMSQEASPAIQAGTPADAQRLGDLGHSHASTSSISSAAAGSASTHPVDTMTSSVPAIQGSGGPSTANRARVAPMGGATNDAAQVATSASPRPRKYRLPQGALLAAAGDSLAWGQLQLLCRHWTQLRGAEQPMVMLHPGASRADVPASWREHDLIGQGPASCAYLECPQAPPGRRAAGLAVRFSELIAEVRPAALVIAGSGFDLVHLSLMARQMNVPVIRLAAGESTGASLNEIALSSDLLNRSADLVCVPSVGEHQRLLAQGAATWRVARVAPMTAALLRAAVPAWPTIDETWAKLKLPASIQRDARQYALVTGQVASGDLARVDLMQWLMVVRHAQDELPLVWLADQVTADTLAEPALQQQLRGSGVTVADVDSARAKWAMLARAQCVIAGPGLALVEEARVLGVPSVVVHLRGDRRAEWAGSGVTEVGPSQAQFLAAVRSSLRSPHHVRDPSTLSEAGVTDMASHIAYWLKHHDALPFQLHPQIVAA